MRNFPVLLVKLCVISSLFLVSSCGGNMLLHEKELNSFVLKFGGDDFDYENFILESDELEVSYIKSANITVGGRDYLVYEFRAKENVIKRKNGNQFVTELYSSLPDPPGEGSIDGQPARLFLYDKERGNTEPIGRAVLWKYDESKFNVGKH